MRLREKDSTEMWKIMSESQRVKEEEEKVGEDKNRHKRFTKEKNIGGRVEGG